MRFVRLTGLDGEPIWTDGKIIIRPALKTDHEDVRTVILLLGGGSGRLGVMEHPQDVVAAFEGLTTVADLTRLAASIGGDRGDD